MLITKSINLHGESAFLYQWYVVRRGCSRSVTEGFYGHDTQLTTTLLKDHTSGRSQISAFRRSIATGCKGNTEPTRMLDEKSQLMPSQPVAESGSQRLSSSFFSPTTSLPTPTSPPLLSSPKTTAGRPRIVATGMSSSGNALPFQLSVSSPVCRPHEESPVS